MSEEPFFLEVRGVCPICWQATFFRAHGPWLRGTLICQTCKKGSVPRERALALTLSEMAPNWRDLKIHESSPANRGISIVLKRDCAQYIGSHYYPNKPFGVLVDGWRNEDLGKQTFDDEMFDLVISLDVMEHVFHPDKVFREIYRTLKPGGMYISTFPIHKRQVDAAIDRAILGDEGKIVHIKDPEYHGNPISNEGALVTVDYGHDIHQRIAEWTDFDVRITRFCDKTHGILGEYTEVIVCKKAPGGRVTRSIPRRSLLHRIFGRS